ncbi:hypothetical protein JQ633_13010 [Bradyrhizobium tropiciagri]|uniref:hypothetical protein n=1 Tax=Bradyrhizobium tropiciagri TaxID=312253 RepID=UPI001BA822E5|nr:hypothetical protein [Bradyrhizobium tropiciagri]MBR0871282.1 hypothetical protein [Bradyrhizobium tropiciagri]
MIENTKSAEGEYKILERGDALPEDFKNEYWEQVKRILREVFDSKPSAADDLRKDVNAASPDTQTAFYHADPFEVAADLMGRRGKPITPDEKQRYLKIKNLPKPPGNDDLNISRPEDKP